MTRSIISPSHLSLCSLFLSVLLLCATFSQPQGFEIPQGQLKDQVITSRNEKLAFCKLGQDGIKNCVDHVFSNVFGTDSTETGQNQEAHPNTHSIQLDTKTQINHDGERNKDSDKSSYKLPKKQGGEQLLDGDIAVNVELEIVGDGDYVLKIKRMNPSSSFEDEVERAKRMAQNGAMLLLYGEMLQDMGEKLLAQSQASVYSLFKMPIPPKLKFDQ